MIIEKTPIPKPELGTGGLNIVRKLDLAITSTQDEINLLLELEAQAARGLSESDALSIFEKKFLKLPQFASNNDEVKKYINSLLEQYKNDDSTFVKKMTYLNEFLKKCEQDAAALDAKYNINETKREEPKKNTLETLEESVI